MAAVTSSSAATRANRTNAEVNSLHVKGSFGSDFGIVTSDAGPWFRKPLLYPSELRGQTIEPKDRTV